MKENYRSYEVNELVMKYQNEKSEEVFQKIMRRCENLIYSLARKYLATIPGIELEDLVSEGNIVLWDAVQKWDKDQGSAFTSFLYSCLCRNYNTLYTLSTRQKRNAQGIALSYEQLNSNSEYEEEGDTLGNRAFSVECEDYALVEIQLLLSTLKLSENEKKVVALLVAGNSKTEIARYMGTSTPTIHSYVKRIGKKLIQSGLCA